MIIQSILLGMVALSLIVSVCRDPKRALPAHLAATPMWAMIMLTIYYGWEALVIGVFIVAMGAVLMRIVGMKFAQRAVNKISKKITKACGQSIRHAYKSLTWFLTRGLAIPAVAISTQIAKRRSSSADAPKTKGVK